MAKTSKKASRPVYTGVFLTEGGKAELLHHVPLRFEHVNVFAHHMTIWFKKGVVPFEDLPIGEIMHLRVLGYTSDASVVAAVVAPPHELRVSNKVPHITVATASGVKPFHSNSLLEAKGLETRFKEPVTVEGKVGWFDGRKVRFDRPRP